MGHDSGWIALQSGIAAGVDLVLVPEVPFDVESVAQRMKEVRASGKTHFILLAAEGISPPAQEISRQISDRGDIGFESRLTILGHIQRGGSPTAFDRLLASQLGARAVEELVAGRAGSVVGFRSMMTVTTPLETAINEPGAFSREAYRFAEILAGY
jgi:6-phosphofructokinase 1